MGRFTDLSPFLRELEQLPFVRSARLQKGRQTGEPIILLETASPRRATRSETHRIRPEVIRSHLSYAVADQIVANAPDLARQEAILLAPYVAGPLASHLASKGANFLDLAGNCRIALGERFLVSIEGRRPPPSMKGDRGVRAAGYSVMFALLADPSLLGRPVRDIARLAGVSKSAVSNVLGKLADEGFVVGTRRRVLARRSELLSRLLAGYGDVLRPRLLLGRYRTQEVDPRKLERAIEQSIGHESDWGWGGVSAGRRLELGYSGPEVTVHVDRSRADIEPLARRLRAVESTSGDLVFLRMPGDVARPSGNTRVVHPLLVYLELMTTGNDRLREVATTLQAPLESPG